MNALPKNAPHAFAHARPWDRFQGKQIGRREISASEVFRPRHKPNAAVAVAETSAGAYGAHVTGAPLLEVLEHYREGIESSSALDEMGLEAGKYFIVSAHREENVDNADNLRALLATLEALHEKWGYPVVVSTHPRTANRMEALGLEVSGDIRFLKPFGYFAYNRLQKDCFCALSDSGTISEESSMLGFPAVTIRNAMERPEALDTGAIVLTGLTADVVLPAVELVTRAFADGRQAEVPADYQVRNTAQRVVHLVVGTCRLHQNWTGLADYAFER